MLKTTGYCSQCQNKVPAIVSYEDHQVYYQPDCKQHPGQKVRIWDEESDFLKVCSFTDDIPQPEIDFFNPEYYDAQNIANPILCLIEVTQRCNLHCPVCFRGTENRDVDDFSVPDPNFAEIIERLKQLKKERPDIDPTIAFTGGEPTLRDDLPDLIRETHRLGFSRTEVITNGIRLAHDFQYAKALYKAGLSQLGFQFDGFQEEIYLKLRGTKLLEIKMKALENLKQIKQPTILAVCVVNGINTDEVGKIIHYAVSNKSFVEHINLQTIALTEANPGGFTLENKINPSALVSLIEQQTGGEIQKSDFYPPIYIKPVPEFIGAITGKPQEHLFPLFHPLCNLTTYVYVDRRRRMTSVNKALKMNEFLQEIREATAQIRKDSRVLNKSRVMMRITLRMLSLVRNNIFRKMMLTSIFKRKFDPLANLKEILMISCADYLDYTTYNDERVQRCGLFFLTEGNRAIPFCAYNLFGRKLLQEKQNR